MDVLALHMLCSSMSGEMILDQLKYGMLKPRHVDHLGMVGTPYSTSEAICLRSDR